MPDFCESPEGAADLSVDDAPAALGEPACCEKDVSSATMDLPLFARENGSFASLSAAR
jgi:hypothetical protein